MSPFSPTTLASSQTADQNGPGWSIDHSCKALVSGMSKPARSATARRNPSMLLAAILCADGAHSCSLIPVTGQRQRTPPRSGIATRVRSRGRPVAE